MNYDKILQDICFGKARINIQKVNKILHNCINIKKYLLNRFEYVESIQESLYRIKNNVEIRPVCPVCGKQVKYIGRGWSLYRGHCSTRCSSLDKKVHEKLVNTCLNKYGVTNGAASEQAKEKSKKTCLEKYGVEYSWQSENNKEKSKETLLKKYGVDNPLKSKEVQEKVKETCLKKYGFECVFQNDTIKQQINKTNIKKYGVSIPSMNPEILNKIFDSRRKNHTFNTSKPEEELYLYIKEKFPSVRRQYKDKERYPWYCDFYIPELDLFLELNGTWTHGKHPFNINSKEDISILNIWKEKSKEHSWYKKAIEGWAIYDVKKRNKAKEEKLNYYEFWTLKEAKQFIDTL